MNDNLTKPNEHINILSYLFMWYLKECVTKGLVLISLHSQIFFHRFEYFKFSNKMLGRGAKQAEEEHPGGLLRAGGKGEASLMI